MTVLVDIYTDPARRTPDIAAGSTVLTAFCKTALIGAGLWFLAYMADNKGTPFMLLTIAVISYVVAGASYKIQSQRLLKFLARGSVPCTFGLLVLLNVFGLVGTLTGSWDTTVFSSSWLVAAPFYFLSAGAFIADIADRRMEFPWPLDYLLYLALPFKLLAGPLEPPTLIAKIQRWKPRFSWVRLSAGWPWIVLGGFMKFVISDRLVPNNWQMATDPLSVLVTAGTFELKFYFDFAGYSFIGFGLALFCGFHISRNFMSPFFAPNVVLFWRRWHMSLGRFLSRYILEPNVRAINGRTLRLIFTSAIFLVSAMWHGGTRNYALWGMFHAACYYAYVNWIKHWKIPKPLGIMTMISFFVLGRLLASNANWPLLMTKLVNLADPAQWMAAFNHLQPISRLSIKTWAAIIPFLCLEGWSIRHYGTKRAYHLFRKPIPALVLLVLLLLLGKSSGVLLYARI